jgi:hypothetical protein
MKSGKDAQCLLCGKGVKQLNPKIGHIEPNNEGKYQFGHRQGVFLHPLS